MNKNTVTIKCWESAYFHLKNWTLCVCSNIGTHRHTLHQNSSSGSLRMIWLFFLSFCFLFIFGCTGSSFLSRAFSSCGARASHCSVFSSYRAQALGTWDSVVAVHRLYSMSPEVVAPGLSCSSACGIFPDQGSNTWSLHWQTDSFPLCQQGNPPSFYFLKELYWYISLKIFLQYVSCNSYSEKYQITFQTQWLATGYQGMYKPSGKRVEPKTWFYSLIKAMTIDVNWKWV